MSPPRRETLPEGGSSSGVNKLLSTAQLLDFSSHPQRKWAPSLGLSLLLLDFAPSPVVGPKTSA